MDRTTIEHSTAFLRASCSWRVDGSEPTCEAGRAECGYCQAADLLIDLTAKLAQAEQENRNQPLLPWRPDTFRFNLEEGHYELLDRYGTIWRFVITADPSQPVMILCISKDNDVRLS